MTTNAGPVNLIPALLEAIRSHPFDNTYECAARIEPAPDEDDVDGALGYLLAEGFVECMPAPAVGVGLLWHALGDELTLAELDTLGPAPTGDRADHDLEDDGT